MTAYEPRDIQMARAMGNGCLTTFLVGGALTACVASLALLVAGAYALSVVPIVIATLWVIAIYRIRRMSLLAAVLAALTTSLIVAYLALMAFMNALPSDNKAADQVELRSLQDPAPDAQAIQSLAVTAPPI